MIAKEISEVISENIGCYNGDKGFSLQVTTTISKEGEFAVITKLSKDKLNLSIHDGGVGLLIAALTEAIEVAKRQRDNPLFASGGAP